MNRAKVQSRKHHMKGTDPRGSVLIVMMWLVLALCGLALVYAESVSSASMAQAWRNADLDAELTAMSGIEYVKAQLNSTGGDAEALADLDFEAVAAGHGIFWVMSIPRNDDDEMSYAPVDESGLLNINTASKDMLVKLPGMTEELAASIIDWRDSDDEISAQGAENEHYMLLSNAYQCKNADFESIDELLLVNGASEDMIFGDDKNRNGLEDDGEADAWGTESTSRRSINDDSFYRLITAMSSSTEDDESASGSEESKINVNDTYSNDLSELIKETVGESKYYSILANIRGGGTYDNIIAFYYASGLTLEQMQSIEDRIVAEATSNRGQNNSASSTESTSGLINVNTAPEEVLLCLPVFEQNDVDKLLKKRESLGSDLKGIVWITEVLEKEKAIAAGTYITSESSCYSADIVAVSSDGRAYRRIKAFFDMSSGKAKLISCRDMSQLGWPLDWQILENLKSGTDPQEIALAGKFGE